MKTVIEETSFASLTADSRQYKLKLIPRTAVTVCIMAGAGNGEAGGYEVTAFGVYSFH